MQKPQNLIQNFLIRVGKCFALLLFSHSLQFVKGVVQKQNALKRYVSLVLNWTISAFMCAPPYGSRMDVMDQCDNIFMYGRVVPITDQKILV